MPIHPYNPLIHPYTPHKKKLLYTPLHSPIHSNEWSMHEKGNYIGKVFEEWYIVLQQLIQCYVHADILYRRGCIYSSNCRKQYYQYYKRW